jgi:hypothetical protein
MQTDRSFLPSASMMILARRDWMCGGLPILNHISILANINSVSELPGYFAEGFRDWTAT